MNIKNKKTHKKGLSIIETAIVIGLMLIITIGGVFGTSALNESIRMRMVSIDLSQIHSAQNKWLEAHPGSPFPYEGIGLESKSPVSSQNGSDLTPFFSIDNTLADTKFAPLGSQSLQEGSIRSNPWGPPDANPNEYYSFWSRPAYANINGKIIYVPGIDTSSLTVE
jgi:hypothetical protein